MQKGDIYIVEIPASGGHEQAGMRPAIIVQAAGFEGLPTVLIVPITSKQRAAEFPSTFMIEPDEINNLDAISVALVFQLRAIDKKRLKNKIGKLKPIKLKLLKQILKDIIGLD